MPQLSMLKEVPTMTSLRIEALAPQPGVRDATEVMVYVGTDWGPLMPLSHIKMPGVQVDFFTTLFSEVAAAWAFEEGRRNVQQTVTSIAKAARAHQRNHDF